ncbi:TetR/AcrR family transcriptional regulator [Mycobacterium sp. AZCC_0083]|uniref:TetR/AcrR family transcriptional regulator n=1 Tax=Mycobacterium sp. AZCC_0083 TaxID=2735882 RepID=UPI00161ED1A1
MRHPPDQKAKARKALIQAGARALKTSGFNGIGVDGLASSAGVTSGAFYSNFPTKEAILEAVIDAYLRRAVRLRYRVRDARRSASMPI